jgi:hypothetical protein
VTLRLINSDELARIAKEVDVLQARYPGIFQGGLSETKISEDFLSRPNFEPVISKIQVHFANATSNTGISHLLIY